MKVIIAGSRDINDYEIVCDVIDSSRFHPTEIISGGADGVDVLGEMWAEEHNIPVNRDFYIPDWVWDVFGKKCGPIRNRKMAEYADAVILIWDGESPGTKNMKKEAENHDLLIHMETVGNMQTSFSEYTT